MHYMEVWVPVYIHTFKADFLNVIAAVSKVIAELITVAVQERCSKTGTISTALGIVSSNTRS